MRSLGDILRGHWKRAALTQAAFARAVGVSPSKMSELLTGRKRLSRRRLAGAKRWCDALDLVGAEADELVDAMYIAAAEPRVRAIIARLDQQQREDQMRRLEAEQRLVAIRRAVGLPPDDPRQRPPR